MGLLGSRIRSVFLRRKDLRTPLKPELRTKLVGQSVGRVERRAKYLLFETEDFLILNHLGMTGAWRKLARDEEFGKHDHVVLEFESGLKLVFTDPRRFGIFELLPKASRSKSRWLKNLGIEPFDDDFSGGFLFTRSRRRKVPIKNFIMDQRQVVGVGNIYASEALFRARVRPGLPAGRLTAAEADTLVRSVRELLSEAINAGGSTIRDYRNSEGESGEFQDRFQVYGREGEPCAVCGTKIRSVFLGGRNTFWCPKCQR